MSSLKDVNLVSMVASGAADLASLTVDKIDVLENAIKGMKTHDQLPLCYETIANNNLESKVTYRGEINDTTVYS